MNQNNSDLKPVDVKFMRAALNLSRRGLGNTFPNPSVGCLLVKNGLVVGRGWTQPGGRPHAETQALQMAGSHTAGATAYVTLEPCSHVGKTPPCVQALIDAKVTRVVVAVQDPDGRVSGAGMARLHQAGISVSQGICEDQARTVNLGYFLSRTEHRPLFTVKLATDRHGLIPGPQAHGADQWITSQDARNRGHLMRANHDAVLFGIGTVLSDDPLYTCRLPGMTTQSPVRVLLDSRLRVSLDSKLVTSIDQAPLWVVCGEHIAPVEKRKRLEDQGVIVIQSPGDTPSITGVAKDLAKRGITRVLVESGPKLVNAFFSSRLVDELAWFRADRSISKDGVPAFSDRLWKNLGLKRTAVLKAGTDHLELYVKGV